MARTSHPSPSRLGGVVNIGTARLENLYRKVTKGQPESPRSLHVKSILAMQNGRHAEAAQLIGMAAVLDPSDADHQRQLGTTCFEAGWLEPAATALNRSIYLRPDDPDPWFTLGQVFDAAGNRDHARTCYEQCLALNPRFHDARIAMAEQDLG
ncbi:tetratricopeptide repeat protein [Nisaea sediminum]|uniref:tetratricopeptide repeat protein n=1 Tax=Nisaea sediminum TaxID=2775867 RepID=UPI0018662E21|nr:tetratricopeptide repeat protein [Nisaea sediminum]